MKKKKRSNRARVLWIVFLSLLIASLAGLFIAYKSRYFLEDDPNPILYIETILLADETYPFVLQNNAIEYRNASNDDCWSYVQGNIITLDGEPMPDSLYEDLSLIIILHEEAGDDTSSIYISPPSDTGELSFGTGSMPSRRYSVYLKSRSSGEQLSPQIPIDKTECDGNVAEFNLVQVREIP